MQHSRLFALTIGLCALVATPALAAPSVLEACTRDFANAGCKPTTEAEAHQCIERYEKAGQKDEGLTHACYEAHERYEKKHGKEGAEHPNK